MDNKSTTPAGFQGHQISASLTVKDIHKSLTWYHEVMDFAIDRKHEREGKLVAVSLQAGNVRLLINQDDGAKGVDRTKGVGLSLQITTEQNIDEIAQRIKKLGGVLSTEPADMPWGARAFRIQDPDGFKFVISTVRAVNNQA